MSYHENKCILFIFIAIIMATVFFLYVFNVFQNDPGIINNFQFWGRTCLIFAGIIIVFHIVTYIIFAIIYKIVTKEDIPSITDERDNKIELIASKYSSLVTCLGFLLAMVTQAVGLPPYYLFIILFADGFISEIVDSLAQLYLYRKGV